MCLSGGAFGGINAAQDGVNGEHSLTYVSTRFDLIIRTAQHVSTLSIQHKLSLRFLGSDLYLNEKKCNYGKLYWNQQWTEFYT